MNGAAYRISFRVKHPQLEPRLISKRLQLRAKTSWKAGSQRLSPSGKSLGIAEVSYCAFALKSPKTFELSDALEFHLERLQEHREFLDEVVNTGGTLEFYVGWFVESHIGDIFGSQLLKRIGLMGIDLSIEIYGRDKKIGKPTILTLGRKSL
jgi:hypothetical protein